MVNQPQGVHALRALSVLCVCIGPEEEEAFRSLRRPLRALITRSRHEGVRVGAVHTLALACFICSSDDDDTNETLDLLSEVFSRTSDGEHDGDPPFWVLQSLFWPHLSSFCVGGRSSKGARSVGGSDGYTRPPHCRHTPSPLAIACESSEDINLTPRSPSPPYAVTAGDCLRKFRRYQPNSPLPLSSPPLSRSLKPPLSLALSLPLSRSLIPSRSLSLSHSLSLSRSLTPSLSRPLALSLPFSLPAPRPSSMASRYRFGGNGRRVRGCPVRVGPSGDHGLAVLGGHAHDQTAPSGVSGAAG